MWPAVPRSSCRYRSVAADQTVLRLRLRDLAATRVRYGYRRLHVLLRREGWQVNHKRVYRLYREEGLGIRVKRRKKLASAPRVLPPPARRPHERWSLDFLADSLVDGRRFRVLTIVDNVSRVSPAIEVGVSLTGERVVAVLERLQADRGTPERIAIDNGPEFISKALDAWAYRNGVQLEFSRPGKPTDNAFAESFNGRFRDECLESALVRVVGGGEADRRSVADRLQHGAPPSGAWTADAGSLGSGLGTGSEGTGLTFQVDQTGGQVKPREDSHSLWTRFRGLPSNPATFHDRSRDRHG